MASTHPRGRESSCGPCPDARAAPPGEGTDAKKREEMKKRLEAMTPEQREEFKKRREARGVEPGKAP